MAYDPQKHHRKSIRLKGYDYSLPGAYFVTMVTYQRQKLFGEILNGEMRRSRCGEIVQEEWFASTAIRKEIRLFPEQFVVMPDHLHGIVWIEASVRADGRPPAQTGRPPVTTSSPPVTSAGPGLVRPPRSLGSFIAGFKSSVTTRVREELNLIGIWHRNYHDHIIRDERALDAICRYIQRNPLRWAEDHKNKVGDS